MIKASASGKILWIGGYSVLERPNVSLVSAVNARVHAEADFAKETMIECPQFSVKKKISEMGEDDKQNMKFLLSVIDATGKYLKAKGFDVKPLKIKTVSDGEFSVEGGKSGLGSSAAVTVATTACILALYGITDKETIHKIAQFAHSAAQGKVGSGFDIAAATYGTIRYVRYSPSIIDINENDIAKIIDKKWDYEIKAVEWPEDFRIVVGNFLGESASTSALVKKVMEFKKQHLDEYSQLMKKLNDANTRAIDAFGKRDYEKFAYYFNEGRLLTKELGEKSGVEIEPTKSTQLIERLVKEGGALAAKLPGAGGGDSIAAICTNEESEKKVRAILSAMPNIKLLNIRVENTGVAFEH